MTDPNTNKSEEPIEEPGPAAPEPETSSDADTGTSAPPPGTNPEDLVAPVFDAAEIEAGKTFAILSYALSFVGLPFFLLPVIMRDNAYSLFHAKQSMMIWLCGIILGAVSAALTLICIGPVVGLIGGIFLLVLNIMGLMQAVNSQAKTLPLIGPYAMNWFKGLTVISKS